MGAAGGDSGCCWGDSLQLYLSSLLSLTFPKPPSSAFHAAVAVLACSPLPCEPPPSLHPSFPRAAPAAIPSCSPARDSLRRAAGAILHYWCHCGGFGQPWWSVWCPWRWLRALSGAELPLWCCLPSTGKLQNPPQAFGQVQSDCRNCNSQECGRAALLGVWSLV